MISVTRIIPILACVPGFLAGCTTTAPPKNPPGLIGTVIPSPTYELDAFDIQSTYAYILGDNGSQGSAQLYVVDITNPTSMALVSTTTVAGSISYGQSGLRVQGQYVYLLSSTGTASTNLLQIYNVSNPRNPTAVGSVQVPLYALGLWVSGSYAYVISFVDGDPNSTSHAGTLDIVDISNPAAPAIVGSTNTGIGGVHVADIKVVGNYAYVAGQSPAQSYVDLFDISNPASPHLLSSLPVAHSPQGLDVQGTAWFQSMYDDQSLTIFNVANPTAISQTSRTAVRSTCSPQDVVVEGTTAYIACFTDSSIAILDVSNQQSPTVSGYISLPGPSSPLFLEARGSYIYAISNTTGGALAAISSGQ